MEPATLYIVPTPIGNLEDITLRALKVLKEVDTILCEDTRTSSYLLKHYEITRPLQAYHQHNEHKVTQQLVDRLSAGEKMAMISDAGTPGISDAAFLLIRACHVAGVKVVCLPGATALIPALVATGFPTDRFTFEGFLPHKKGRQTRIKAISQSDCSVVMYESPHRLVKLIDEFIEFAAPERIAAVSRELTKHFEENKRGPLTELKAYYEKHPPKGEIVFILMGEK
jgi:16S rRNA (cytidine1402-2'-O)-methyltransferase